MNMQTAIQPEAPVPAAVSESAFDLNRWVEALADYRAKRAISDALDGEHPDTDDAIDAYCLAMDHLIQDIAAPCIAAVALKHELLRDRFADFGTSPAPYTDAILNDLKHLAEREGSLILQLHARYESIWQASNRLDCAMPAKSTLNPTEDLESFQIYHACERGMGELAQESTLLQQLLLRQIPESDEEATVQLLHARILYDCGDDLSADDRLAIEVALTNVTDYFIGEGRADMERLGKQFSNAAMQCWSQRRHREGATDGDA